MHETRATWFSFVLLTCYMSLTTLLCISLVHLHRTKHAQTDDDPTHAKCTKAQASRRDRSYAFTVNDLHLTKHAQKGNDSKQAKCTKAQSSIMRPALCISSLNDLHLTKHAHAKDNDPEHAKCTKAQANIVYIWRTSFVEFDFMCLFFHVLRISNVNYLYYRNKY